MSSTIKNAVRSVLRVPALARPYVTLGAIKEAVQILNDPILSASYFPEAAQKSRATIVREHLWWAIRNGAPNRLYFSCGLDRVGTRPSEQLTIQAFQRLRNPPNLRGSDKAYYNHLCLVRDKLVFALVAESLGYPVPKVYAIVDGEKVDWLVPRRRVAGLDSLLEVELDAFCKPVAGVKSRGIFRLGTGKDLRIDGTPATLSDLRRRIAERSTVEERVVQHPEVARLHPSSVNTVRLITVMNGTEAVPFAALMRVGTGGRPVDNWSRGGVAISVDMETAKLRGHGFYRPGDGTRIVRHPDTGIVFDGYAIPMLNEAIELACRFHSDLRHIHSIGWDLALRSDGPCFIEGNDNWSPRMHMVLESDFKARFLATFSGGRNSVPKMKLRDLAAEGTDL